MHGGRNKTVESGSTRFPSSSSSSSRRDLGRVGSRSKRRRTCWILRVDRRLARIYSDQSMSLIPAKESAWIDDAFARIERWTYGRTNSATFMATGLNPVNYYPLQLKHQFLERSQRSHKVIATVCLFVCVCVCVNACVRYSLILE